MVAVAVSDQQGTQIGYGQASAFRAVLMRRTDTGVNEDMCYRH